MLKRLMGGLKGISKILGSIPSIVYGIIFLLQIPVFAFIYNKFPLEFHHATIRYENVKEKQQILGDIEYWIKGTLSAKHKTEKIEIDCQPLKEFIDMHGEAVSHASKMPSHQIRTLEISSLRPFKLDLQSDEIKFYLPLELQDKQSSSKFSFSGIVAFHIPRDDESFYGNESVMLLPIKFYHEKINIWFSEKVFPYAKGKQLFMPIPHHVVSNLRSLKNKLETGTNDLEDSYWRMLYFSGVTITTLGYGDIVPITTRSRLFVSLEAILGIITVGLFLNALAHEARSS